MPNKGRLAEETRGLFDDAGLDVRAQGDRALTASLGGEFEALFVRAQDIPEFVADGAADAGVTGWDLVCESGRALDSLLDLGFGRCRLVVAAREESARPVVRAPRRLARRHRISADRALLLRLARLGDRGRSDDRRSGDRAAPGDRRRRRGPHVDRLDAEGQRPARDHTIMVSTARLIAAPGAAERAPRGTGALRAQLGAGLGAAGARAALSDGERSAWALDDVKRVIPGLNGPTVIDILNGGRMSRYTRSSPLPPFTAPSRRSRRWAPKGFS